MNHPLAPFFSLKENARHLGPDFIADSPKVVFKALEAQRPVKQIISLEKYRRDLDSYSHLLPREKITFLSKEEMQKIVGYKIHQGLMGQFERPVEKKLHELKPPMVILNGVCQVENVGQILRTCACFGIPSVIYDQDSASPWLRRSVRVSMGGVFHLSTFKTTDLSQSLLQLKQKGITLYTTAPVATSLPTQTPAPRPTDGNWAIILGREESGVDPQIAQIADHSLSLPMQNGLDSLNVSTAAAILIHGHYSDMGSAWAPAVVVAPCDGQTAASVAPPSRVPI